MRWEHHVRQRDHLLPGVPGGVPQLSRLLLAHHRGPRLRHQTQLHPDAGARAARFHHCVVSNDALVAAQSATAS